MTITVTNYNYQLPALTTSYDCRVQTGDTDFQLAAGHWVAGKMPLTLVYPRPDSETSSYARHKKQYTGLQMEIPIVAQGGAWPFHYKIVTAPAGATIGENHGDANYGVLVWSNPTAGSHDFGVRIIDHDFNVVTARWTCTVGTSGFVFVDDNATDDTGAGTIGDPLKTIEGWYKSSSTDSTYQGDHVIYRAGTYSVTTTDTSLSVGSTYKPMVHLAYPGETAIFDCNTSKQWFWDTDDWDDVYVGGIRWENSSNTVANSRFMNGLQLADRATVYDCYFYNGRNGTSANDNESCFFINSPTSGRRNYFAFINNTYDTLANGTNGFSAVDMYQCSYVVFQGNTLKNISSSQVFWPKVGCQYITARANTVEGGTWTFGTQMLHFFHSDTDGEEGGPGESCYNLIDMVGSNTNTAFPLRVNGSPNAEFGADTHWSYRNTYLGGRIQCLFNGADAQYLELEVIVNERSPQYDGSWTVSNCLTGASADNIVDANGLLQGSYRTSYLGLRGHEIS